MSGSIKLFKFFQKIHQTIGIHPSRTNLTDRGKIVLLVCFAQILFTAIFMFNAKSMFNYGFAFFMLICLINAVVIYLIFIWESENTLKFIQNCEAFIEKNITRDVAEFNIIVRATSDENRVELTKRFCDMVQIYTDAKQCVVQFNQVITYSLFSFFSWNMLSISSILVTLQFELWADDSNLFAIVLLSYALFWMVIFNLLLCEPGAQMTNRFDLFCGELARIDWHFLPIGMQRMYVVFISDAQNSMRISSYANITSERETSKAIVNTAFSYFMTFRRLRP